MTPNHHDLKFRVTFTHRPPVVSIGIYRTLQAAEEDARHYPGECFIEESVDGVWRAAGLSSGSPK